MKTVTTREVQHHFSRVLEMVEAGEEVIVTRRGKRVVKIVAVEQEVDERVDWKASVAELRELQKSLPKFEGSLIEELRSGGRY